MAETMTVDDAVAAALGSRLDECLQAHADALYAFEQFPGPSTESVLDGTRKTLLRAQANLRHHVLDRDFREGRRL